MRTPCQVEGCGKDAHAHKMCSAHLYRATKYGNPHHVGPGRSAGRNRTPNPGYDCVHRRLSREKGKASNFQCVHCGKPAEEWAYIGGCPNEQVQIVAGHALRFSEDQTRYRTMCRKCHRARDESGARTRSLRGTFLAVAPTYVAPSPTVTPHPRRVVAPSPQIKEDIYAHQ